MKRPENLKYKPEEHIGKRYGRLMVMEYTGRKHGEARMLCLCDCGKSKVLSLNSLIHGTVRSCRCLSKETTSKIFKTHGGTGSPTWRTWISMMRRCNRASTENDRKNYQDRGIRVSPEWHDYANFLRDMGEKPKGLTIERKNNDLGYSKENCKWATKTEQARNRRGVAMVWVQVREARAMRAEGVSVARIARCMGLPYGPVYSAVNNQTFIEDTP